MITNDHGGQFALHLYCRLHTLDAAESMMNIILRLHDGKRLAFLPALLHASYGLG